MQIKPRPMNKNDKEALRYFLVRISPKVADFTEIDVEFGVADLGDYERCVWTKNGHRITTRGNPVAGKMEIFKSEEPDQTYFILRDENKNSKSTYKNKEQVEKKSFIDRNEFLKTVSIGKRFVHYIVDIILGVYAFSFLLGTVFGMLGIHRVLERINPFIFGILLLAVYYIFCEFLFNRTVGKLFTGSVVVTENGDKPSFGIVLLRTLIRFVPFEPFSILSASTKMWHDTWTKTTVVKSNSLK